MNTDLNVNVELLTPGSKILCAVSGGADSMALLHCLWSNREKYDIEIVAAHYDHQLRGIESARDRTFVKEWCRKNSIECKIGFGNVLEYSKDQKMTIEEAARDLRYKFLYKTAKENDCDYIATAHNADDNVETLLLNLTRGTALTGLCGIPEKRGMIIRPILGVTRGEIIGYLNYYNIEHVEDSTNGEDDYSRNKIRHQIMPVLKELNPSVSKNVIRTTTLLKKDNEYLNSLANNFIKDHYKDYFIIDELKGLPEPILTRVLKISLGQSAGRGHIYKVLSLLSEKEYKTLNLPDKTLIFDHGKLYLGEAEYDELGKYKINTEEKTIIKSANLEISAEIFIKRERVFNSLNIFDLKYENICGEIICTSWQPGDKIKLPGRYTKKLKDLYNEAGLSKKEKDLTPVFRDNEKILAVAGFGTAENMLAENGEKIIRIKVGKYGGNKYK